MQLHAPLRVIVGHAEQGLVRLDLHAEFLAKLSPQRRVHVLAGLELAPRELPQAALVPFAMAPGQQNLAPGVDEHGHRDRHGLGRWNRFGTSFDTRH